MLFFGLSLATGVAALLIAQKLDIECTGEHNPAQKKALLFVKKKQQKDSAPWALGVSTPRA